MIIRCALMVSLFVAPTLQSQELVNALSSSQAKKAAPPKMLEVRRLSVFAAAEPQPALKYDIPTTLVEKTNGNAAVDYYRAVLMVSKDGRKLTTENHEKWSSQKLSADDLKKIEALVSTMHSSMQSLEWASTRDKCDWGIRIHDLRGGDVFSVLLPELAEMRLLARILNLKARLHIARGEHQKAFDTIRIGFQMGKDIAKVGTLVNGLVGVVIVRLMCDRIEELATSKGSMNLYWAMRSIRAPAVDLLPGILSERDMLLLVFPVFRGIETAERSDEEWKRQLDSAAGLLASASSTQPLSKIKQRLATAALVIRVYPIAKKRLIARGMPKKKVDEMCMEHVFLLHTYHETRKLYHDFFKWMTLPYYLARPHLARADESIQPQKRDVPIGLPIAGALLPAITAIADAQVELDRRVALIANLQAIRMHAAANKGAFPSSLAEIKVVPTIIDPATNQPFHYELKGNTATLTAPALKFSSRKPSGRQYVITLK